MSAYWGVSARREPDEALTFLQEQFSKSAAGAGRLVLLSGGPASGKTQLQNDLLQFGMDSGAITLSATGARDEQPIENGVIEQLLGSPALPTEVTDQLCGIIPTETSGHAQDSVIPIADQIGGTATRDVCRALLQLARNRCVVIGIDDLQFADEASINLLLQLQRRIRSTRLLIVLNQCGRTRTNHGQLNTHFTRHPHYHLQLEPFSTKTVKALISDSLGSDPVDELPGQIHELSGGNPILANALVDDYRAGDRSNGPAVGVAFSQAILDFLHRWDPQLPIVACALAVAGADGGTALLAPLSELAPDVVGEMLTILTGTGLIVNGEFRHPNARTAALECLPPATCRRLHARAAELKYQQAATSREVAEHLVAADEIAGEWSVPVLRDAAGQAARTDDMVFATKCLELVMSACTDTRQLHSIQRSLAAITWRVNPSGTSFYLESLRQALTNGTLETADSVTLMFDALRTGDEETFAKARAVQSRAAGPLDSRMQALTKLAYHWHYGPAEAPFPDSGTPSRPNSDPWDHTANTLARVWTRGGDEATTVSAERILRNCRLDDTTLEALSTAITALVYDGRIERAEEWCTRLRDEAERRGAVTWKAMLDGMWSGMVLRAGDVERAARLARTSLASLDGRSWGVAISYPLTTLIVAGTTTGDFDAVDRALRHPVPDTMLRTVGGLRYLRARGQYHLATDRILTAISDFQKCGYLAGNRDIDHPVLLPWRSDLAEANLRLGNIGIARDLADQQLHRSAESDSHTRGISLRILALTGEPSDRAPLLDRAARLLRESGDHLECTKTLDLASRIPAPLREPGSVLPVVALSSGWLGLSATASQVKHGAPAVETAEPSDPAVLSEAELRVAHQAVLGRTNRQIGSTLFITVSTVEQHLTRIYRKLGVSGRTGLPAELAATGC